MEFKFNIISDTMEKIPEKVQYWWDEREEDIVNGLSIEEANKPIVPGLHATRVVVPTVRLIDPVYYHDHAEE